MTPIEKLTDSYLNQVNSLFHQYLEMFPEEKSTFSILEKQFELRDRELCSRQNMTGHLTASGLLLHPDGDSVLLIHHNFLKLWLQPGGHLDAHEQPADGAVREFIEETGIRNVALHPWHDKNAFPFDMDTHAIPPNPKKSESSHYHHDYQYLLCMPHDNIESSAINIDLNEVSNYRWVGLNELIDGDHDLRLKRSARKILNLVSLTNR